MVTPFKNSTPGSGASGSKEERYYYAPHEQSDETVGVVCI
jgi:hypothetical protein